MEICVFHIMKKKMFTLCYNVIKNNNTNKRKKKQ